MTPPRPRARGGLRRVVFVALLLAIAGGCVKKEVPRRPDPDLRQPHQPVPLGFETPQMLIMDSGPVVVRMVSVQDSRCPRKARCVQAGEGRITLAIAGDGFGTYRLELSTTDELPVYLNRLGCRLETLDPYPEAGVAVEESDYRAVVWFYGAELPPEPEEDPGS